MILGGTISYGETRKIADYESKTAKVELSFAVAEGTDYDEAVERVMSVAKAKCHAMLGFTTSTSAPVAQRMPASDDGEPVVPKRAAGRPRKVELTPAGPKPEPQNFTPPPSSVQLQEMEKAPEPEPAREPDPAPTTRPLTDAEVTAAVSGTQARIKNAPAIRELAYQFGVEKGLTITTMAQERREAFIEALKGLQPAGQKAA